MPEEAASSIQDPSTNKLTISVPNPKLSKKTLVTFLAGSLIGGAAIFTSVSYGIIKPPIPGATKEKATTSSTLIPAGSKFCDNYGIKSLKKTELLKAYIAKGGETLKSIAKSQLGGESKATELLDNNLEISNLGFSAQNDGNYYLDHALPADTKVYLPNSYYDQQNVTSYSKVQGNIIFSKDGQPLFNIVTPNTSSALLIIPVAMRDDVINKIPDHSCVEAVTGFNQGTYQTVLFDVKLQ